MFGPTPSLSIPGPVFDRIPAASKELTDVYKSYAALGFRPDKDPSLTMGASKVPIHPFDIKYRVVFTIVKYLRQYDQTTYYAEKAKFYGDSMMSQIISYVIDYTIGTVAGPIPQSSLDSRFKDPLSDLHKLLKPALESYIKEILDILTAPEDLAPVV